MLPVPNEIKNLILLNTAEVMTDKDEQKDSLDFNFFDAGRGSGHPFVNSVAAHQDPYPHPFTGS